MVDEVNNTSNEEYKQEMIQIIRERSRIPSSMLRRIYIQNSIQAVEMSLLRDPNNPLYKAELEATRRGLDRLDDYRDEDKERDGNMITSADILDLYLSELADYRRFKQAGVFSERTEELAKKVASGLAWGIEADKKYDYPKTQYGMAGVPVPDTDRMEIYRRDLLRIMGELNIPGLQICINHILSGIHQRVLPGMPIRDLKWEPWRVEGFLNFLSNDLR